MALFLVSAKQQREREDDHYYYYFKGVQESLAYFRKVNDNWNPLLAGGWTGFIFGRAMCRKSMQIASIGAVNGALLTWLLASVSVSKVKTLCCHFGEALNPFTTHHHENLHNRIIQLQNEISILEKQHQTK